MKRERLGIAERPIKQGELRHESTQRRKVVVAGAEEKIRHVRGRIIRLTTELRMLRAVQKRPDAFAIACEHDVIPSPGRNGGPASQGLFLRVAIVEKKPSSHLGIERSANAEVIARRSLVALFATRKKIGRHRICIIRLLVVEP